jgi:hypothetical protein
LRSIGRNSWRADGPALLRGEPQGCHAAEDIRRGLAGGDRLEGLPHQPGLFIGDYDLPTLRAAVVPIADGRLPRPPPTRHGLLHAGLDLLRTQLIVELVEDGENALDGPTRGGVVQGLSGSAEADSRLHQELLEGGVDIDVSCKARGVVHHEEVDPAGVSPKVSPKGRHHLPEGRAIRRLRALPFLAVDGLDGPTVASTVLAAGSFLDVERQVGDLFLG